MTNLSAWVTRVASAERDLIETNRAYVQHVTTCRVCTPARPCETRIARQLDRKDSLHSYNVARKAIR
jgi:hypothetical protein